MSSIVVGVDGSPGSVEAFRFAVREARVRGCGVTAVNAWSIPLVGDAPGAMLPSLAVDFGAEAELVLGDVLTPYEGEAVEIERRVVEGPAARVLVDEAAGAAMLVVGSRGRGGFTGLLLGSVSRQCAHHATCPVVVVPERRG